MKKLAILCAAVCAATCLSISSNCFAFDYSELDSDFSLDWRPPPTTTTRESRYTRGAEAEIRFQEGLLHYNGGKLVEAEGDFKALIAADPADAESYYYLGLSQLDQDRPDEAIANFNESLKIDPSPDEVRAARATAYIRARHYDEAKADIDAISANPRFASLAEYLRGQMLYAQGDLKGASKAFADAKAMGSTESAPAGFYEGLTYLRMRELVRARESFRESSVLDADRDPTLAAASRQLDAVLALQQKPSKPWEAQITLAYEYDSNVIQLGGGIPVPAGISGQHDWRWVFQPRGSYSFIQNDKLEVGVEGNGYFSWQNDLSDFDIASYQAGPFVNYKLRDNLYVSARYGFNYVELGHDPFLKRNIFTPQITYVEKDFGYTSAYYQFQTRQFHGPSTTPELSRSGQVNSIGLVQGIDLPAIFRDAGATALELTYRYDAQAARGSDFDAKFNTVGATFYTPLPFWNLRADVGVNFNLGQYDNANSLDTVDHRHRRDLEFDFSTGVTKQLTKNVALRVDYSYTNNDSNVVTQTSTTVNNVTTTSNQSPYEYDRSQLGIRLIFSF